MDVDVIVALIGLSGISLGALFSGLGYFFKIRSERKRTKKNVLFHLLEIRHLIRSEYLDPEEFFTIYIQYFKEYLIKRGITEEDSEASVEIKQLLQEHFQNIGLSAKPKIDDTFIASFEDSLKALSYEAPILAFQLRGRNRIDEFISAQNSYLEKFEKLRDADPEFFKQAINNQVKSMHYEGLESLIKDFDKDIKMISRSCGFITHLSLRKLFKDTKKPEVKIDIAEMDKTMDKFFTELASNINTQKSSQVQLN